MGASDFRLPLGRSILSICFLVLAAGASPALPADLPDAFEGGAAPGFATDQISEETYARIEAEIEANVARLGLVPRAAEGTPAMAWPLAPSQIGYFSYFGVGNYVDQDLDAAQTLDYNCGARTYDGHRGMDIFPSPFPWLQMDNATVDVIAAAPGTIISRSEGQYDRRCSCEDGNVANYVIVEHVDGSRAWYLHLKNGSVTSKQVGETVTTGEYLGKVGSSGCSSSPHLHFELRDSGDLPGAVLDPNDGTCNSMNPDTLWISQRPYRVTTINHLSTNFAQPSFPTCPSQEVPNEKRIFQTGDTILFVVYLTDELTTTPKSLEIIEPDGSLFETWEHTSNANYNASRWSWNRPGPNDITGGAEGRWRWRATLNGVTRERAFWVGAVFADDFEDANLSAWSDSSP